MIIRYCMSAQSVHMLFIQYIMHMHYSFEIEDSSPGPPGVRWSWADPLHDDSSLRVVLFASASSKLLMFFSVVHLPHMS